MIGTYAIEYGTHNCDGACPHCGAAAIYGRDLDRYFHVDGSNNWNCWAAISRGDAPAERERVVIPHRERLPVTPTPQGGETHCTAIDGGTR